MVVYTWRLSLYDLPTCMQKEVHTEPKDLMLFADMQSVLYKA